MSVRILIGDVRDRLREMPDASMHCVVTSPPYWGLRDYGTGQWEGGDSACDHRKNGTRVSAKSTLRSDGRDHTGPYDGEKATIVALPYREICGKCGARRIDQQIGMEPTLAEHIATLVEVFREVRRVMRDDATLWLNYGDCYNGYYGGTKPADNISRSSTENMPLVASGAGLRTNGLKPKDLCMVANRLAIALQDDGWWVRSEIIWHKPNPMPESVTDRPTSSHEKLWLLTKSPRYYYDAEAVRAPSLPASIERQRQGFNGADRDNNYRAGYFVREGFESSSRNLRNVWTIATAPFPEAHFATFPPALVEPCIKAGTSERGCCAKCGASWRRDLELVKPGREWREDRMVQKGIPGELSGDGSYKRGQSREPLNNTAIWSTRGWVLPCTCNAETVPATVFDPFGGSGTVGLVADRLGRNAILIELNPEYADMAERRIRGDSTLFSQVSKLAEAAE